MGYPMAPSLPPVDQQHCRQLTSPSSSEKSYGASSALQMLSLMSPATTPAPQTAAVCADSDQATGHLLDLTDSTENIDVDSVGVTERLADQAPPDQLPQRRSASVSVQAGSPDTYDPPEDDCDREDEREEDREDDREENRSVGFDCASTDSMTDSWFLQSGARTPSPLPSAGWLVEEDDDEDGEDEENAGPGRRREVHRSSGADD